MLGDYGKAVNPEVISGGKIGHPTEIADFYNIRIATISELNSDAPLKEAEVKNMTGDAMMKARRMREDFWEFQRTHLAILSTNHKPTVAGVDEGIWRRLKLIPFDVDLRQVAGLEIQEDIVAWFVKNEGPGIINWIREGIVWWMQEGWNEPQSVTNATLEYRDQENPMRNLSWIAAMKGMDLPAMRGRFLPTIGSGEASGIRSDLARQWRKCSPGIRAVMAEEAT